MLYVVVERNLRHVFFPVIICLSFSFCFFGGHGFLGQIHPETKMMMSHKTDKCDERAIKCGMYLHCLCCPSSQ
jgi:hypothetical protein